MRIPLLFRTLLAGLALACFVAGSSKPPITVRFFLETNSQDTEAFASPIQLKNPPRSAYIEKMSAISESDIVGIYSYPADGGSWGCLFKLDDSAKRNLEIVSAQQRGHSIVAFVGTKKATRQVIDMIIDRRISDGMINIPRGLTEEEILLLKKQFHTIKPPHEACVESGRPRTLAGGAAFFFSA